MWKCRVVGSQLVGMDREGFTATGRKAAVVYLRGFQAAGMVAAVAAGSVFGAMLTGLRAIMWFREVRFPARLWRC